MGYDSQYGGDALGKSSLYGSDMSMSSAAAQGLYWDAYTHASHYSGASLSVTSVPVPLNHHDNSNNIAASYGFNHSSNNNDNNNNNNHIEDTVAAGTKSRPSTSDRDKKATRKDKVGMFCVCE